MEDYVIHYGADTSEAIRKIRELEKVNNRMAKSLGSNFQKATNVVKTSLDKVSQTKGMKKVGDSFKTVSTEVFKAGTVIQTADGKYKNFVRTLTVTDGKLVKTKGSLTDVTGQYAKTTDATTKASKATKTFGENVGFLAKRAILVIPLWLLLRGAITGVINVFKNGVKDIIAFDKILQKAKQNLVGSSEEIDRNFKRLRKSVTELSIETGKSVEDITSAFQKFATTGLTFEESWAGAEASVKASILLFGDTVKIANSLARTYRVLGKTLDNTLTPNEKMQKIVAQLHQLWKVNAFTLDEFSGALERFAPVANSLGIPLEQTNALLATLHTAGIRGTRTGRLLGTSFIKLTNNLQKLSPVLGITTKSTDDTLSVFLRVTKAIKDLNAQKSLSAETAEAIKEIFGGVRAGQTVRGLIAIHDTLQANLKLTGDIDEFNKSLEEVTDTIGRQAERMTNLKKEVGKTFLIGITGAEDFKDSLKGINDTLELAIDYADVLGKDLGQIFAYNFGAPIGVILDGFRDIADEASAIHLEISRAFGNQLNADELIDLLARIQVAIEGGVIQFDERTIDILRTKLADLKSDIKTKLEDEGGVDIEVPVKLSVSQEQAIGEEILKLELDRVKATGAIDSQLILAEKSLVKQLGLSRTNLDLVKQELEYQYAITKEKREQTKVESDTIRLMKIAQEHGTKTAERIGNLLSGDIDLSDFGRRYKDELAIVQKEFKGFFESEQAKQFFKGDSVTGAPGLRGGYNIPIQDEAIRGKRPSAFNTAVAIRQGRAERQLLKMESKVEVNVNAQLNPDDLKEFSEKVGQSVADKLKTKGTILNDALNEGINNY